MYCNGCCNSPNCIQSCYSCAIQVNIITPPLGIHRICNGRARGRGHYKCDVSRAGVLSTYLCNNEWAYQRCTPIAHAQMLSRGIQQGKWRTHGRESMAVFSFHTGFSIHFRSQFKNLWATSAFEVSSATYNARCLPNRANTTALCS